MKVPFKTWQDLVRAGKWRKKRLRPARHHLLMREALKKERLLFRDYVMFYNKYDQLQYIDLLVRDKKGRMFAILWSYKQRKRHGRGVWNGGIKPREKVNWNRKIEFLEERGVPYLVLHRYYSMDEMRVIVRRFMRTI